MNQLDTAVAVTGMALRVPGASTVDEFWANLAAGKVTLPATATPAGILGGQIERFAEFDAELFGMTSAQAAITDPQHRVLTELAWLALEDAALDTERADLRVGVFLGCGQENYLHANVLADSGLARAQGSEQILLANSRDFLATALSYRLGLTGPSMTIQTACSTSLVAIHQAVRSLLTYECDVAVAGGATVHPVDEPKYAFVEGGITSPDGRCRSFTEGSRGTVPSSGAGVVVLRRASDVASGAVQAYIVGSAVNNDGADRMGLTAPSPRGQAEVIKEALDTAGLDAADIGYIETHGTGTILGDQVELSALAEVYGTGPQCALGAVKVNIGHTDTAAGVIGLIKAALTLREQMIPPTPAQPADGPDVPLRTGRFVLPRTARPWTEPSRHAAVSSFGLGGTNAHVILAAPAALPTPATGCGSAVGGLAAAAKPGAQPIDATADQAVAEGVPQVAVLSAADGAALDAKADALLSWLDGPGATVPLADVLGTLWHGRRQLGYRWAAAVRSRDDLRAALAGTDPSQGRHAAVADAGQWLASGGAGDRGGRPGARTAAVKGTQAADPVTVAALLPGQGFKLAGAGRELAEVDRDFAADLCELEAAVLAAGGPDLAGWRDWPADDQRLVDTAVVQPILFTLGLSFLQLLARRGVNVDTLLGHSIGELTAATHAGVFTVADGAAAVVRRGALMAAATPGGMVAVRVGESLARELGDGLVLDVCGLNGPDNTVLGGDHAAMAALVARCAERGYAATLLPTSHAFHSRAMEQAAGEFEQFLRTLTLREPRARIISNLTGAELEPSEATDPTYWSRQLRGTVRLADAVETLLKAEPTVVVGAHGGRTLVDLVRQAARRAGHEPQLVALDDADQIRAGEELFGQLWAAGYAVVPRVPGVPARPARLPGYPFAATRHWVDATPPAVTTAAVPAAVPVVEVTGASDTETAATAEQGFGTTVAAVWQRSFGGAPLQPDDNFFRLGGSSLQAAHLVAVINDELLVEARLNDLYEYSSLAAFTGRVETLLAERDDDELLRMLAEIEAGQ